ncbi:MarR family winged helix-turn-helix transcriptional regulator [Roseivivax sediminis]|uniref:DNA-binding transcriptional regulator, MarR family n=1 Tax=Roseivivax sediminis TaxID=936889 RepID=A0A1I1ZAE9_9RHOB|nr:MarR family transcriptional regulator [Roseivivax sediminis]SFE27493.1 DNA-binding transcriptional regulator, MarR family [Roseivivax sediminis]
MGTEPRQGDLNEGGDGDAPFVADYLLFLLASTSAAASAEFHAVVRAEGLRVREWRVLACLHDEDGQMTTRLAELALMEQSRLTRIIDQMHTSGLVERRSDAEDRRRVRVFLTERGAAVAANMIEKARAHEAALIARLPGASGETLKRLLKRVHAELVDGE